ncbi:hypothetical protein N9Y42_01665, partial [Mariniblastus sp.]|nr:hypothetical protein [Mariniblastus sp.]
LNVGDLEISTQENMGQEFTIREDDLISGSAGAFSGGELTIERPHTFERLIVGSNSIANYQQELGESEGVTVDVLDISPSFANPMLNLGFDSQSTSSRDWVLRTESPSASQIEDMIDDGRIVVTGAEFEVVDDPAIGFTYIQSIAVLLGDVDLNGTVDFSDISPFITILSTGNFQAEADCDESGEVDFSDIAPFIVILASP